MTLADLRALFAKAGEVTAIEIIKDPRSGLLNGIASITMSTQSEGDNAISMYNSYILHDHVLDVYLAKPGELRDL